MLSGWFAWCLVFISGELLLVMSDVVGLGRDGTLAYWVTHSVGVSPRTPWQAPGIHPTHPVGVVACTSEP